MKIVFLRLNGSAIKYYGVIGSTSDLDSDKPPYGPKYDLVLGQGWLWAHRTKIDMYRGNLIINNCRIPLICEEKNIGFSDVSSESESEAEPITP